MISLRDHGWIAVMDDVERIARRLKPQDVRVLIAVVEAGSMHKAAERLRTSQSAISRSIADLEQSVGVRLLERSRHGIEPTPYGRVLVKRGVAAFDEFREGVKDIKFLADPSAGELRIGCPEAMASGPVLAVIEELARQHPRLVFRLVTGSILVLYPALAARHVELIISPAPGTIPEEHVNVGSLFEDNALVMAGVQSPWARRRRIELEELVNEPWTLPAPGGSLSIIVEAAFRARGLAPPAAAVVTESSNVRNRLAATGRFLTVFSEYSLRFPRTDQAQLGPSLKALPVELPGARRTVKVVNLKNRSLSPLAELFIDRLRAVTKPLANGK
jgi:DNA-binding transcriptional LysR family regulator